jgi:hypothetical protein
MYAGYFTAFYEPTAYRLRKSAGSADRRKTAMNITANTMISVTRRSIQTQ